MTRSILALSFLGLLLLVETASAQYPAPPRPPIVTLGAPVPADGPPTAFLGARYSFYQPRTPYQSFSYYGPGYVAPRFFNPRYLDPGPYYYSPAYPYAQTYYSYYYTPGFFRY